MPSNLSASQRKPKIEWPTIGLLILCYATWLASVFWLFPVAPAVALAVLAVAVALHSSLQHEVLHGHPTRSAIVNEALVFLPLGLFYPYRRFRETHLKHHCDERLTDPYDDPESFYRAAFEYERLPGAIKTLLQCNNTLVGRLITGPALMIGGFICADLRKIANGNTAVIEAWLLHIAGLVGVFVIVSMTGIPFWLYTITAAYGGLSLIAIRTYAEHQWSELPDGRTIIVERSPLSLLFLNNNLHLVHHKFPALAWYRLPSLYRERREEWLRMNGGYVFPGYAALFREYAFRPKEPVAHPVLRREADAGRNLHPVPMAVGGRELPIPAEPPKK